MLATQSRKQKSEQKQKQQFYGYFKRQTGKIADEKTQVWLRNEKFKSESEPLLIAAQTKAIRTNYVKAKIYDI